MRDENLKIGDVAERLNITIRTIRYYEEEGLLEPQRTERGTRLYSVQHIRRLRAIIHLVENGFSLDLIRSIGCSRDACATGDEGSEVVSGVLNTIVSGIDEQLNKLKRLKSELKTAEKLVKKCSGCQNEPSSRGCPECSINRNLSKTEVLNLIWE